MAMRRAALAVGSDGACDLVLDARCRRASPRHALIFVDEVRGTPLQTYPYLLNRLIIHFT